MTCLTPMAFALFIAAADLDFEIFGPIILVRQRTPRAFVWRRGLMCSGGVAL